MYVIFNKIDAYNPEYYDEFSLTPKGKEHQTLEELKNSWIASEKSPCIFISAINKTGIEKLRGDIYRMVSEIRMQTDHIYHVTNISQIHAFYSAEYHILWLSAVEDIVKTFLSTVCDSILV